MSDNVTLPGDGAVVATDDVGGRQFQLVKVTLGADGANDGTVSAANALPVADSAGNTLLAALQTLLTTLAGAIKLEDSPGTDTDPGVVVLAQRRDSDTTAVSADGDYACLKTDEAGRLKVASQPASYGLVSGNITAVAGQVACDVARCSNVVVMMNTSSLAGHNCTFEGSLDSTNGTDGTWFTLQAVRSNANTIETATGTLAATPAYSWELSVNACNYFRVRATAHTSGTATWKIQRGTYATEPIPAAQISGTQPVSFTQPALVAGTALIGDVSIGTRANATNAGTYQSVLSPATPAATAIKATGGRLLGAVLHNSGTALRSVKFWNQVAAGVTLGTTAAVFEIGIPAGGLLQFQFPAGIGFGTAMCYAITGGKGLTDNTAVTLNDVTGVLIYA